MEKTDPVAKCEKILLSTDGSPYSEGAAREAIKLGKICGSSVLAIEIIETNPEFEALALDYMEKEEKKTREHLESIKKMASLEGIDCETMAYRSEKPFETIIDVAEKNQVQVIVMGRRGRTGLRKVFMGSVTAKVIGLSPCNVLVVPKDAHIGYKNILIATDGSPFSEAAASEAVGLAKHFGANLFAVSVVLSDVKKHHELGLVDEKVRKEIEAAVSEQASDRSEKFVRQVKELADQAGVTCRGLILAGTPYEEIVNAAVANAVDLIVIGTHGKTGLRRLLMGSVTERVIALAESAVLVVKTRETEDE